MVTGITYFPDYINQEEHDRFLLVVDQHPWRLSVDHDVQVYGYSYNHTQRAAIHVGELPNWAVPLAQRLHQEGYIRLVPNQLVVNAYPAGAGIFEHIDQSVFGDTVISVSLGSMCTIRFSQQDSARCEEMVLEPKSLLVLSGESRWQWKHGIPARPSDVWDGREYQRTRRVSLTFRAIPDGATHLVDDGIGRQDSHNEAH